MSAQVYDAVWGLIGVGLVAGWVAWALLGGNNLFFTAMVVATIVLGGGASVLLRRGPRKKAD